MAQFEGTISEFTRFLGSYCRIKVMQITTKYKKGIGKCEECNSTTKQLEAAHIKGKERPLIISNILSQFIENDIVKVDLKEFQERFIEAHMPLESTIRILCTDCHRNYDKINAVQDYIPEAGSMEDEAVVQKLEASETKAIEKLIKETLNKSRAIAIVNERSGSRLSNSNTLFSNINSAVDVWWLEPYNEKFKPGFNFILNYPENRALFHFYLPPNTIEDPVLSFYQRNDSDYSKIYIPKSTSKFIDKKGFDFGKYLVREIKY